MDNNIRNESLCAIEAGLKQLNLPSGFMKKVEGEFRNFKERLESQEKKERGFFTTVFEENKKQYSLLVDYSPYQDTYSYKIKVIDSEKTNEFGECFQKGRKNYVHSKTTKKDDSGNNSVENHESIKDNYDDSITFSEDDRVLFQALLPDNFLVKFSLENYAKYFGKYTMSGVTIQESLAPYKSLKYNPYLSYKYKVELSENKRYCFENRE